MWWMLVPVLFAAEPVARPQAEVKTVSIPLAAIPAVILHAPAQEAPVITVSQQGRLAESPNFVVRSIAGGPAAKDLALRCESWRAELRSKWLGTTATQAWNPRCEIILHGTQESYLAAVGRGGAGTLGSSLVQFDREQISSRSIDLLATAQHLPGETLPHEITHVVLADHFGTRRLPRWADEGLATLADTAEKQRLHHLDLQRSLKTGQAPRLSSVLLATDYPAAEHRQVYYGYSLSLAKFLSQRADPQRLVEFLSLAQADGYTQALREIYAIESLPELEHLWRAHTLSEGGKK